MTVMKMVFVLEEQGVIMIVVKCEGLLVVPSRWASVRIHTLPPPLVALGPPSSRAFFPTHLSIFPSRLFIMKIGRRRRRTEVDEQHLFASQAVPCEEGCGQEGVEGDRGGGFFYILHWRHLTMKGFNL